MPTPKKYVARDGRVSYQVRLRAHGKQTSESFQGPTAERLARQFCKLVEAIGPEAAIAQRDRRDRASSGYMPTLAEWLPKHVELLTGVTERTRIDYKRIGARTFLPILGELPLDMIDRAAVAKFVNAMDHNDAAAKSIHNAHGVLSAVMASAVAEGHIDANPCHKVRLPKAAHDDRSERFLTHEEYRRLLAVIPDAHRPLVVTMFGTGLRWSEITSLLVRDVTAGRPPSLRVTKAWKYTPGEGWKIGPPKSAKSRRTVMLPEQVVDEIRPRLDAPPDALLFPATQGGMIYHGRWRERVWVTACLDAGLATTRKPYDGPRIHDARHTHASWLIEQGATLEMVQDQLGHESILVTRRVYGHLQPAMRAAVADAATRALAMGDSPALEA